MKTIRWGILGASNFAKKHMGPAIHAAHRAELVALATSTAQKAEGFRAFCPSLKVHESYEALLADEAIDAVYVPLPNHLHVEWTKKALAAGKHVLTEKPIALSEGDFDGLIAARDASGLLAAEAYMIAHHPQWARARDWIAAGEIGELIHADAVFSYLLARDGNIRNSAAAGGGSLRDIGVYTLGSLRLASGAEPSRLEARVISEDGVDSFAHVFGVMKGASGQFTFTSTTSMRAYKRQVVTLQGSKGMIRLEGGCFNANVNDLAEVELHRDGNSVLTERFAGLDQYVLQVQNFGESIRSGKAYPCPLEWSRGNQRLLDMVFANTQEI